MSLGARKFSLLVEAYGRRTRYALDYCALPEGATACPTTNDTGIPSVAYRGGGRAQVDAWIGNRLRLFASYDLSTSLDFTPDVTGYKSLRLMMEGDLLSARDHRSARARVEQRARRRPARDADRLRSHAARSRRRGRRRRGHRVRELPRGSEEPADRQARPRRVLHALSRRGADHAADRREARPGCRSSEAVHQLPRGGGADRAVSPASSPSRSTPWRSNATSTSCSATSSTATSRARSVTSSPASDSHRTSAAPGVTTAHGCRARPRDDRELREAVIHPRSASPSRRS